MRLILLGVKFKITRRRASRQAFPNRVWEREKLSLGVQTFRFGLMESKPLDLDLALESKPLDLDFSGFLVPTRRRGNPFGTRQRPVFAERDAGA